MNTTILTKRGQVSVPARLKNAIGLKPGMHLRWERVSNREFRVVVEDAAVPIP